jgi:putative transcriptional regulator
VRPQLGTVLYSCTAPKVEGVTAAAEIYPGVHTTQHFGDLAALARRPPEHMRLVLGYAGWGEEQLIQEILRNDWITAPVQEDLIFTREPEGIWERTLRSVGVDPASLPSWTAVSGETAN